MGKRVNGMDIGYIMPAGHKEVAWSAFLLLFLNIINVAIEFSQPNSLSVVTTNRKYLEKAFKKQKRQEVVFPLVYSAGFQQTTT